MASLESPKDASDPNATSRDRAALALVTLSRTSEDWKAAQAEIEAIGLRPLALVQSIEQLKLQRAQSGIAAKELAAELQAQKVRIRLKQEGAYLVAKKLSRGEQLTPFLDRTLQQAYYGDKGSSPLSVQQRKDLLRASGQYWYASGYLEQLANSLQTKLALLEELRKANESENSLKQWDALIRSQVDLLEVWSKTGVKADTIKLERPAAHLIGLGALTCRTFDTSFLSAAVLLSACSTLPTAVHESAEETGAWIGQLPDGCPGFAATRMSPTLSPGGHQLQKTEATLSASHSRSFASHKQQATRARSTFEAPQDRHRWRATDL